jgi:hypothetical protein
MPEHCRMSRQKNQEIKLTGGGRTAVTRKGNVVFRKAGAWTSSVHALLRYRGLRRRA